VVDNRHNVHIICMKIVPRVHMKPVRGELTDPPCYLFEAGQRIGLDFQAPNKWPELLEAAGFVDITIKWVHWPLGPWAKADKYKLIGRLAYEDFTGALDIVLPMFKGLGWSTEKSQVVADAARNELKEQKTNLYQKICFCYARKPDTV
jgi:hypothetical protein